MSEIVEGKLLEIRDNATCISALAVKLDYYGAASECIPRWLLKRAGWDGDTLLVLTQLDTSKSHWDPFKWDSNNTMKKAHGLILMHWDEITNGQVIDVRDFNNPVASDYCYNAGGLLEAGEVQG